MGNAVYRLDQEEGQEWTMFRERWIVRDTDLPTKQMNLILRVMRGW